MYIRMSIAISISLREAQVFYKLFFQISSVVFNLIECKLKNTVDHDFSIVKKFSSTIFLTKIEYAKYFVCIS